MSSRRGDASPRDEESIKKQMEVESMRKALEKEAHSLREQKDWIDQVSREGGLEELRESILRMKL